MMKFISQNDLTPAEKAEVDSYDRPVTPEDFSGNYRPLKGVINGIDFKRFDDENYPTETPISDVIAEHIYKIRNLYGKY